MEFSKLPPELAAPPPERAACPELEYTAPPPEYGQGSGPAGETPPRKRRFRQFLALPAVLLVGFLCLHGVKNTVPDVGPEEPVPVETAEPIPERPEGSVLIDVLYAVRDTEAVRYSYTVFTPIPSLDATQEQIDAYKGTPYPISVYARVSDEAGHLVAPADDPDVWEGSRSAFEYSIDAAGLEGELTLTLTAVYTEEGEERQSQVEIPLEELPPRPETFAELSLLGSGGIDYYAEFNPQPGDEHDYQLSVTKFDFVWFDAEDNVCGEAVIWDFDTLPTLNGNSAVSEKAIAAAYQGPAWIERPNDEAVSFCVRMVLWDESSGYPYTIDSNLIELSADPILNGRLVGFPGGDVYAEFSFRPAPGDTHDYSLRVNGIGQIAFEGEEGNGFSLMDDPSSLPVTGDNENGYQVIYSGHSMLARIPSDAQLCLVLQLEDTSTREIYRITTNRVDAVERILPYETWPLEDGKIAITVYNDTDNYTVPSKVETDSYLTILAVDTIPEAEFESYVLPSAWTPDGYDFAGWVIHVNNPFDLSSEEDIFSTFNGDPPPEALTEGSTYAFRVYGTLTRDDVERIPPSEDGVRYVNVHAVWIKEDIDEPLLYLDNGAGELTAYSMETPLASEGYIYLCNYPVSAPGPDLEFDGWYDSEGNQVELLVSYFSFVNAIYNADGSFAGYDWGNYEPVYLTAHWK